MVPRSFYSALAMGGYSFWNQAGQFPIIDHRKSLLLLVIAFYSIFCLCHSSIKHSPKVGHLECFQFVPVINIASVTIFAHKSLCGLLKSSLEYLYLQNKHTETGSCSMQISRLPVLQAVCQVAFYMLQLCGCSLSISLFMALLSLLLTRSNSF